MLLLDRTVIPIAGSIAFCNVGLCSPGTNIPAANMTVPMAIQSLRRHQEALGDCREGALTNR